MAENAYELLGPLARGGFSSVWLARARDGDGALVAIKRLRRRSKHGPLTAKKERQLRQRGRMEFELHRRLVHPNVVRMIEYRPLGGSDMLIMEYVNGVALDEWLELLRRVHKRLPIDLALEVAVQAGRGLDHAHRARGDDGRPLSIIHRDVKPSNIMIGRDGWVKVMDFGVARWALAAGSTTTGTIKGTLRYLSPEQARGARRLTGATDQYSLALVLAEMVIGRPVYDARPDHEILLMAMRADVEPVVEACEAACPGLGAVLERAFRREPNARYPDIRAFLEALMVLEPYRDNREAVKAAVHEALELRARLALEDPSMMEHCDEADFWNTTTHSGFGARGALALHAAGADIAGPMVVEAAAPEDEANLPEVSEGEHSNLLSLRVSSSTPGFSDDDALDLDLLRMNPESEDVTTEMVGELWARAGHSAHGHGGEEGEKEEGEAAERVLTPHIRIPGVVSSIRDQTAVSPTHYAKPHRGRLVRSRPEPAALPFVHEDEAVFPARVVSLWASDSRAWTG